MALPKHANKGTHLIDALAKGLAPKPVAAPAVPAPVPDARYQKLLNPLWPEARWDVSGAFAYDLLLMKFHDFFQRGHGVRLLTAVHGSPLCLWNGGRQKWNFRMERDAIEQTIRNYDFRAIPLELTFSSTIIHPQHLQDFRGNFILDLLSACNRSRANGVIVCEETLAEHVRKHHPTLRLIASVVKVSKEDGKGKLDYYRRLAERYDKVMIHPDDNFNLELLAKLENKEKYEVLINESCIRDCPVRKRHYQILSELGNNLLDSTLNAQETQLRQNNGCENLNDLLFDSRRRTLILSTEEIKRIYELGFRDLKIQGRGMESESGLAIELFRLMFNHSPECDHLAARMMHRLFGGG
jgi:hypothetical protein